MDVISAHTEQASTFNDYINKLQFTTLIPAATETWLGSMIKRRPGASTDLIPERRGDNPRRLCVTVEMVEQG